jgi:hypothetical protein
LKEVFDWFSWFFGKNLGHRVMYNKKTGGCYDGLTKTGINKNQGAESTICYLLAHLSLLEIMKGGKWQKYLI